MTTVLNKELKRQVSVDSVDYTVRLDAEGLRLTGKGKRKPEVELRWRDLLSGEAALAVALNASLLRHSTAPTESTRSNAASKRVRKTPQR